MKRPIQARSEGALQARLRGGAGVHADRRTRRVRTRGAQKRQALTEWGR